MCTVLDTFAHLHELSDPIVMSVNLLQLISRPTSCDHRSLPRAVPPQSLSRACVQSRSRSDRRVCKAVNDGSKDLESSDEGEGKVFGDWKAFRASLISAEQGKNSVHANGFPKMDIIKFLLLRHLLKLA